MVYQPEPVDQDLSATLADILRGYLVRAGNNISRYKLASRLVEEDMTATRLQLICETMDGRGKPEAETAAYIGQVLKTREGWQQFVEDRDISRFEGVEQVAPHRPNV